EGGPGGPPVTPVAGQGGAVALERAQPVSPLPPAVPPVVVQGPTDPTTLPAPAIDTTASAAPPVQAPAQPPVARHRTRRPPLFAGKPPPGFPDLPPIEVPHPVEAPREFDKRALAAYIIEPPDILVIQATSAITLPNQPIGGPHLVRPDGQISLGAYGEV